MRYIFNNFLNTIRRYKASSLLNIFGMAVAFASFYIIMTQVKWGLTYNQELDDIERIHVLSVRSGMDETKQCIFLCRPLAEQILSSAPEVESYGVATSYVGINESNLYIKDGAHVRKFKTTVEQYNKGGLSVFGFEAQQGSFDDFDKPNAMAVSWEFAQKNNLKVGDQLSASTTGSPTLGEIVAIWKDKFQENSSIGRIEMMMNCGDQCIDDWSESSWTYLVKLKNADDVKKFEKSTYEFIKKQIIESEGLSEEKAQKQLERLNIKLIPLKDVYYDSWIEDCRVISPKGDKTTDISLLVVAILVILIAMINFINFFFALVPARVKSVNTYKVFGTSRGTLVLNFVMESVGLVTLALAMAVLLTVAFANSPATEILNAPIDLSSNVIIMVLTIVIALAGAVAGSIPPAYYITSFQPAMVLKGTFGTSQTGRTLRNLLIGIQFCISIVLIICTVFIKMQHNYMMNYDMGFNKEHLIYGQMPKEVCWWGDSNDAFENKLRNNPAIKDLTWADGKLVNFNRMGWGRYYKEKQIVFDCYPVAYNFLEVMGIDMVEGRHFNKADEMADHGVVIFNEEAKRLFNVTLDGGAPGHHEEFAHIAGICKDFNFRPLQCGNDPFAFYVFGKDHSWRQNGLRHLYVRTTTGADLNEVMNFIRTTALELVPDADPDDIELGFFDDELASNYKTEDILSKQITAFTIVAVILSLMGVFGLVLFETQHRRKEIAIRRVLGAGVGDVLRMYCRKYSAIVAICFAIAAPISYIIIHQYFSSFPYHIDIHWWVFLLAFIIVLAITITVVASRCLKAATSNPVEAIKTE